MSQINTVEKREHEKELNRKRVAKYRAKQKIKNDSSLINSSYSEILKKFNGIIKQYYSSLSLNSIFSAFNSAGLNLENQAQIQNRRIKSISSLPVDYTKEEIGEFLRAPYNNERPLRETSEILKWTSYPYYKITKTYQDILTYRYCTIPLYLSEEDSKSPIFKREEILVDKLNKVLNPSAIAHTIAGKAVAGGKCFYYPRINVDKVHNKVNYAFLTELPINYCTIIGRNSLNSWTVSFNMMYFLQPGTDIRQYGELFVPFINDFENMFNAPQGVKSDKNLIYANISCGKNNKITFYPNNLNENGNGNPKVFLQNGRWQYWVSLPPESCWVFEIDDTTVNIASPLSGLMLTYSQQSVYEQAQLSLILNPLIKIFTGEIPYFQQQGSTVEDGFRLSVGARQMFEELFNLLMRQNSTGGTAFFTAPVENIKSHDFPESANANEISSSFNKYGMAKAGLSGIIPVDEDVKAGQAELSSKLESRYGICIYRQFEKMMNYLYNTLNLKYTFDFKMFGSIYTDDKLRADLQVNLSNGDISVYPYLAALDGISVLDKISIMRNIHNSDFINYLQPPPTSYTQSNNINEGRPKEESTTEGKEKTIDSEGKKE